VLTDKTDLADFGFLKTKEKNPPKQESLVFLETTVHYRVGEKPKN
jgi:hypothetical protein